ARARGPHDAAGQRAPPAGRPAWEARAGDSCAPEHFPRWRGGTAAGLGETRMTPAAYLNSLPVAAARAALGRCCGARHWVDAMLGALRGRLTNDPTTELRIAAEEQAKITRLRLHKLVVS